MTIVGDWSFLLACLVGLIVFGGLVVLAIRISDRLGEPGSRRHRMLSLVASGVSLLALFGGLTYFIGLEYSRDVATLVSGMPRHALGVALILADLTAAVFVGNRVDNLLSRTRVRPAWRRVLGLVAGLITAAAFFFLFLLVVLVEGAIN